MSAAVDRTSLRESLQEVAGVAGAEVDVTDGTPTGVRIRLDPEADRDAVGEQVQQVLSAHGIRARLGGADEEVEPPAAEPRRRAGPPPPPGAGAVLALADAEGTRRGGVPVAFDHGEPAPGLQPVAGASLAGVAVEETRDGVVVTVTAADGRREARRARWTDGGLEDAVVGAVAALAAQEPPPVLVGTREIDVEGTAAVVVVLERVNGRRLAGAAVVEAGAPFALARAVWAALEGE